MGIVRQELCCSWGADDGQGEELAEQYFRVFEDPGDDGSTDQVTSCLECNVESLVPTSPTVDRAAAKAGAQEYATPGWLCFNCSSHFSEQDGMRCYMCGRFAEQELCPDCAYAEHERLMRD